jgi:hypothetical protein
MNKNESQQPAAASLNPENNARPWTRSKPRQTFVFWRGKRSFAEEFQANGSNPCFWRLIEEIRDTATQLEHALDDTLAAQNRSRSELGVASAQPILTCQFDLANSDSNKNGTLCPNWSAGASQNVRVDAQTSIATILEFPCPCRKTQTRTYWWCSPGPRRFARNATGWRAIPTRQRGASMCAGGHALV